MDFPLCCRYSVVKYTCKAITESVAIDSYHNRCFKYLDNTLYTITAIAHFCYVKVIELALIINSWDFLPNHRPTEDEIPKSFETIVYPKNRVDFFGFLFCSVPFQIEWNFRSLCQALFRTN